MTQAIRITQQGHVATVILSRPDVRNAFNDEVIAELSQAFIQLGDDPQVRAIVLIHIKRLSQIVVSPLVQPRNALVHLVARGDDEDGRGGVRQGC